MVKNIYAGDPEKWIGNLCPLKCGQKMLEEPKKDKSNLWLIWSHERQMYWKPRKMGYTENIAEAGRYELGEAALVCMYANYTLNNSPNESILPSPEMLDEYKKDM